jgi:hypothetical protein
MRRTSHAGLCGRASGLVKVSVPKAHLARLATALMSRAARDLATPGHDDDDTRLPTDCNW